VWVWAARCVLGLSVLVDSFVIGVSSEVTNLQTDEGRICGNLILKGTSAELAKSHLHSTQLEQTSLARGHLSLFEFLDSSDSARRGRLSILEFLRLKSKRT